MVAYTTGPSGRESRRVASKPTRQLPRNSHRTWLMAWLFSSQQGLKLALKFPVHEPRRGLVAFILTFKLIDRF